MLVCRHCGWENPDEAAFCTNCGRGLVRGRAITPDRAPSTAGGRFRALGSPVVTVQASEPPRAAEPPLPQLRAPASTGSAPTLLDFRMPEQMLAELSRMRDTRTADEPQSEPSEPPKAAGAVATVSSRGLGDIARALRAEAASSTPPASPPEVAEARPTLEQIDPPTLEPSAFEPIDDDEDDPIGPVVDAADLAPEPAPTGERIIDALELGSVVEPGTSPDAHPLGPIVDAADLLARPADATERVAAEAPEATTGAPVDARSTAESVEGPPPGLFTDPPVQELPFFESMREDVVSMPPGDVVPVDDDEADLPFVLGPELEINPPRGEESLPPGDSVDLLPPDGSVDFEQEELERPGPLTDDDDADDPSSSLETDGFSGLIEAVPDDAGEGDALEDDEVEAFIEDVEDVDEDDDVLESGDMEAVVVTQTEQPALRVAPPPMPAAASARFVLRPLSENLDDSFVVAVGDEPIDIGRLAGDICFEEDRYLSPLHARFEMQGSALNVTDLDSLNGIWLRVRDDAFIAPGTMFLCGQQVIRLEAVAAVKRGDSSDGTARIGAAVQRTGLQLAVIDAEGEVVARHHVPPEGCRLGRQLGDLVFTRDSFMSGTHAMVRPDGEGVILRDLDSRNGTWMRLEGQRRLEIGDAVMLGRTVLRVGQPSG